MTKAKNSQRAMRPYPTRSTAPVAVRATQTRRRSRGIFSELNIQLPDTRGMQSRTAASLLAAAPYLPVDTDPRISPCKTAGKSTCQSHRAPIPRPPTRSALPATSATRSGRCGTWL